MRHWVSESFDPSDRSPGGASSGRVGVIAVDHLRKTYGGVVAVDDLSFEVETGEIFGILGPNGAGKTTTVECLQGLRRPDSGTIRVLGLDPVTQGAQLRQRIGSQLQDSALPGRLRVAESIELFAAFAHHPVDCDELLARWRLDDVRAQAFDTLSGGQRQRLFIALGVRKLTRGRLPGRADPRARPPGSTSDVGTGPGDPTGRHDGRAGDALYGRGGTPLRPGRGRGQREGGGARHPAGAGRRAGAAFGRPLHRPRARPRLVGEARRGRVPGPTRGGSRGPGQPVLALVASELVAHDIVPLDLRVDRPTVEDAFLALTGRDIGG